MLVLAFLVLGSPPASAKRAGGKRSAGNATSDKVTGGKATNAKAAGGKKRIAVLSTEGADPKTAAIGTKIGSALKQHKIQVVPGSRVQKAIRKDGVPSADDDWVKLARKLKVDGFVTFAVSQDGAERSASVAVRSGSDGAVAGQETFTAKGTPKKLATVVGKSFWAKLGSNLDQTAAPKKEEESTGLHPRDLGPAGRIEPERSAFSSPVETKKPPSAPAPAHEDREALGSEEGKQGKPEGRGDEGDEGLKPESVPARGPAGPLESLEVELDLRVLQRGFQYLPSTAARNFSLPFYTPVLGGHASYYPLRNLGVFVAGEISVGLTGNGYPSDDRELIGGAAFRLPFSFGQVGASVAYFVHYFLIKDTANPADASRFVLDYPNTVYRGGRFAANARFRFGSHIQLGVEAAYRLVTSAGSDQAQVKDPNYFPTSAAPVGVDAGAFVGFRIGSRYEIRGGLDYRRYTFGALQGTTLTGTTINATGAVDQYLTLYGGVVGVFGGN